MASSKTNMESLVNYGSDDENEEVKKRGSLRDVSKESNNNEDRIKMKDFRSFESHSYNNRSDERTENTPSRSFAEKRRYEDRRKRNSRSPDKRNSRYKDEVKHRSSNRDKRTNSSERRDYHRSRSRESKRSSSRTHKRRSQSREGERKKYDKVCSKMEHLKKLGIEVPKYYNPSAVNPIRYAEQIQKRRLLWQKREPENESKETATSSTGINWEATTFAQDKDGKQAEKFKRLMGIKESSSSSGNNKDILKKQEEMFCSMEQQYEVARTATHTMRGVGLGFGNYQYQQ